MGWVKLKIMKIETVKISAVKSNPNNPRIIKDDKFKKLVTSIKEFPQMLDIRPIVVNDEMIVLGGNMRLKACIEAGLKEVSIIKASELTPEQQNEFIIKDNVGFGEWNWDDLANSWDTEQLTEWGLDIPNFEVTNLEAEEDDFDVTEGGIETDIVLGDLFEIGEHRLLCGDSTDSDSVSKLMNGEKADMVFTDPPYGINVVNKNGKVGGGTKQYPTAKFSEIIGDDTTETAKEFYDTCISLGMNKFIIWGGNYFTDFLTPSRCWIVWFKNHIVDRTFANCELAWTNIDHNSKTYQITWDGYTKEGESGSKVHPSQKPIKLCADVLLDFTNESNIIYDGFLGSGSTMVSSYNIKRKCYGMELDPKYCQVIIDRMKKLDPTLIIKRNGIRQD
jgi:DNA modification methylase